MVYHGEQHEAARPDVGLHLVLEGLPGVELFGDVVDQHGFMADVGKQLGNNVVIGLRAAVSQAYSCEREVA